MNRYGTFFIRFGILFGASLPMYSILRSKDLDLLLFFYCFNKIGKGTTVQDNRREEGLGTTASLASILKEAFFERVRRIVLEFKVYIMF